jgi:CRP-like cAMP-binding protein
MPRHQLAAVHDLMRIEMLAGIAGETLGRLADRMERRELDPGEVLLESDADRGRYWVVLGGMLRSPQGTLMRPGDSVNGLTPADEPLRAMTPCVVASCDLATFDELLRPHLMHG